MTSLQNGNVDVARSPDTSLISAVPGLVRVAASSGWRVLEWGATSWLRTTTKIVKDLASGEPPARVIQNTAVELRTIARQALGLSEPDHNGSDDHNQRPHATAAQLRARGAELLHQSADVWFAEDLHPAYERMLDELAPDEARILRLLATRGPQPSIDVRTSRPLGIGSELVASGLSMIGLESGARKMERTNAYLNNLFRLGLVWFSREEVADPGRYQVVEVQPDVMEAMKKAGRSAKTVRRSIHLTPFGDDFCEACLPLDTAPSPAAQNGHAPPT